ncbi:MAG: tripartite tricarboxylate transporter substrate binding protein [Burkholderiales bacterium]|nr:tripartite tricarboxylate transporter substrate binding protein [Burkholderiales bacterium]
MLALVIHGAILFAPAATAQWKPDRKVEFVIGTGAGGVLDITARHIQRIWSSTGIVADPVVVVNKPGGGQSIALSYLNQQAGDGHYLAVVSGIIFSNYLTGKSPYAYTGFTPIAILFNEATVFAVNAAAPIRNANDLMARLRKDPYGPSFAVGSTLGSITHVAAALVGKTAGADVRKIKAVVFNSSGESVAAVMGGHVDVMVAAAQLAVQHAQTGKLRVIAAASAQRLPGILSEVPTWKEMGVDAVVANWRGVIGPRDMKPEQLAYWTRALERTVDSNEWKAEAARTFKEGLFLQGREAKDFLDADNAKTKTMLTELGMIAQ